MDQHSPFFPARGFIKFRGIEAFPGVESAKASVQARHFLLGVSIVSAAAFSSVEHDDEEELVRRSP